jgi:acetate kinase
LEYKVLKQQAEKEKAMYVLVMNTGSSSLKYQLIDMSREEVVAKGLCERVGSPDSFHSFSVGDVEQSVDLPLPNHHAAVKEVLDRLADPAGGAVKSLDEIDAIGHRVVHGGEYFSESVVIDDEVISKIEACVILAPLHNPACLMGIEACRTLMPNKQQVAVFDTAFHQTMPAHAFLYPLPYEAYAAHKIRKYGFHGTSHRYVAARAAQFLGRPLDELKLITCHLGNGCSITAVDKGVSIDTSMGLTPLDGLMMGTRCGSIDPAIATYLMRTQNLSPQEVDDMMNKKSGLLGVTGLSNDLRDVRAASDAGNERATLAYMMYAYAVKRFIGQYAFALAGVDAVVLTAGVAENDDRTRRMVFEDLENFGMVIDQELNLKRGKERAISTEDSPVKILVIPTNEELMIARDVVALVG